MELYCCCSNRTKCRSYLIATPELIFKQWKSLLGIDCIKGTSAERIQCLITGRLCAICLISMVHSSVYWYAWEADIGEVSSEKLVKWLLRNDRLAQVVIDCDLYSLFAELLSQLPKRLLKQKRKRKTTYQRIASSETFDEAFSTDFDFDEFLPEAA